MQSKKDILFAKKDSSGKTIWMKVGMLIVKENNKQSIKLDCIPVGFDGWFQIGEERPETQVDEKPS